MGITTGKAISDFKMAHFIMKELGSHNEWTICLGLSHIFIDYSPFEYSNTANSAEY